LDQACGNCRAGKTTGASGQREDDAFAQDFPHHLAGSAPSDLRTAIS
jgi:hypothetical protein